MQAQYAGMVEGRRCQHGLAVALEESGVGRQCGLEDADRHRAFERELERLVEAAGGVLAKEFY